MVGNTWVASTRRMRLSTGLAALVLTAPTIARADQTPNGEAPDASESAPAPAPSDTASLAASIEEQKKAIAEQQKAIEDLQQKVDAQGAVETDDWTHRFKIYGFTDVGVNRVWTDESSPFGSFANSANATSFVIGNLNLYFDANPVKHWRSLVEIRFSNAPHGEVANVGGLGGTFQRTSTAQNDPNASSINSTMWGGYTVIERAHIDWTQYDFLKVRFGNFFTPFGIWNVDHGSPTLIPTQLPVVIQFRQMPLRQTGIQLYGSTFAGEWELGYHATLTNGRQELSNFAFDDNRGLGGRVYANNEKGEVAMKFGASFYTGRVADQEIDLVNAAPMAFARKSTWAYRENVAGADASIDVGRTRIRSEVAFSTIRYDEGKRQRTYDLQGFQPDRNSFTGYALLAHQLPFAPIEPYVMVDGFHGVDWQIGDSGVVPSLGVNVRFTNAVLWKTQLSHAFLLDLRGRGDRSEISKNDSTELFSRLVLVF